MSLLLWVLFLPLIGVFLLLFVPAWNERLIRGIGFATSLLTFVISLLLWIEFDASSGRFQFVNSFSFVRHASSPPIELSGDTISYSGGEYTTLSFVMGLDGISLFFVVLTTFLIPVCILVGWTTIKTSVKEYCIAFLALEALLIAAFSVLDLLLFYIFFESVSDTDVFDHWGLGISREKDKSSVPIFFIYSYWFFVNVVSHLIDILSSRHH